MSKVKVKDFLKSLKIKTVQELDIELFSLKQQLFNLRFQRVFGESSSPKIVGIAKRNIARVRTEMSNRVAR